MDATTPARRPSNPSVRFVFWLTAAMLLLNIGAIPELTGLEALQWAIAFVLAPSYLFLANLAFRVPLQRTLGAPGFLIVGTLVSCIVIGSIMATGGGSYPLEYILKYSGISVVIVATAVGGSLVLHQTGVEGLAKGLLCILGVTCILILASPWLHDLWTFLPDRAAGRFSGVFQDPNDAGYMGCLTLTLALALIAVRRHRKLAGTVLVLSVTATILSNSRTAIVSLGLISLFFLLLSLRRSFIVWLFFTGTVGVVALTVSVSDRVPFFSQRESDRILSIVESGVSRERLFLWRIGLQRMAESPILGNGLGTFSIMEGTALGDCNTRSGQCGVHNTYLLLLGEAGIVPLALFLLFLGSLLWRRLGGGHSLAADIAAGWTLTLAVYAMTFHHMLGIMRYGFVIGLSCTLAAFAAETAGRSGAGAAARFSQIPPRGARLNRQ